MTQISNRIDIQNSIEDEALIVKRKLPNFFTVRDDMNALTGISLSIVVHCVFILAMLILSALGFVFPKFALPDLPNKDIEFKLVQNEEKPPINKNTKIRSDRNSQAGGKHDPKRPISAPSSKPSAPAKAAAPSKPAKQAVAQKSVQPKAQPKPQPKIAQQPQKQPVKNIFKQLTQPKVAQQPVQKPAPQAPAKPSAVKAPGAVKPNVKPTTTTQGVAKPSAPKIATAPKSPFNIPTAPSGAPVGNSYRPQGTPSAGGGGSAGGVKGGSGSGPAPKFSTSGGTGGTGGGSSRGVAGGSGAGNRYASRGGGGGYGSGNPSPGNPNGAPGIDAIKQPNWGPYMRDLEQRIKRNWSPPKGDSSKRVVITFTIGRDGRLLSHKITKSSGVPLADRAAMSAIELTAPFRPLPPEFKGNSVPIEFTFDYNVLNSVLR